MFRLTRKKLNGVNWQYALGEVLLIFTGITLSLWFNDWSENNKQRAIEIKTLKELKSEILLDTIDINENIRGYQARVKSDSIINYFLSHELPDSAAPNQHFIALNNYFIITFHTAAYETLQSRGVETIRNDSLRLAIIRLYDFDYKLVEEVENHGFMVRERERMYPLFMRNFKLVRQPVSDGVFPAVFMIKNVQALRSDDDFQTAFLYSLIMNKMMLSQYEQLREKILALSRAIAQEVKEEEGG